MACAGSGTGSAKELHIGHGKVSEIGLDVECVTPKTKVKKMDKEKKMLGLKRRSIPLEVGFDSSDDEPIGYLFKLKTRRNPKKVKEGVDAAGQKGKQVEGRTDQLFVKDEDFGGMNDTLASFRKKLRGPKKDVGSGSVTGRNVREFYAEPSGRSLNGTEKEAGLAAISISKTATRCQRVYDSEYDGTVDGGLDNGLRRRSSRSKVDLMPKKVVGANKVGGALDGELFGYNSSGNNKACNLGPEEGYNPCLEETLEDSLSVFFQKAQSGMIRKFHSSPKPKRKRGSQASCDGPSSSSDDSPEDFIVVRRPKYASESVSKIPEFNDNLNQVPGKFSIKSASALDNIETQQKSDDCILQNPLPSDARKELSGSTVIMSEILRPSLCLHDGSSELMLENSVPTSSPGRFLSHLRACSDKTGTQNREDNWQTSGILGGSVVDQLDTNHAQDVNSEQFSCVSVQDTGAFRCQEPTPETQNLKEGIENCPTGKGSYLLRDVSYMSNSIFTLEHKWEKQAPSEFDVCPLTKMHAGVLDKPTKVASTNHTSNADFGKEILEPYIENGLLNEPCQDTSYCTSKQISGKTLKHSAYSSQYKSASDDEMVLVSKSIDGHDGQFSKDSMFRPCQTSNSTSDDILSSMPQSEVHKYDCVLQNNHPEKLLKTGDDCGSISQQIPAADSFTPIQKSNLSSHRKNQLSDNMTKNELVTSSNCHSGDDGGKGVCSPSYMPDENKNYLEDIRGARDPKSKDHKLLAAQRTVRRPKKHRHGDMAYEGDADWERLIYQQDFLGSQQVGDSYRSLKAEDKFNSLSPVLSETENGGLAAVSAGLRAFTAGPVEKIKFKEVLKRKGGLQEYLECRNQVLGLWNKDVSRILPLSDCGVSDTPVGNEPPHTSLIRDVYSFLDHYGFINIGVASENEKAETGGEHSFKLFKERNIKEKSMVSAADSDDGVSFILGHGQSFETPPEIKKDVTSNYEKKATEANTDRKLLGLPDLSTTPLEHESCETNCLPESGFIDAELPNRFSDLDFSSLSPSSKEELHENVLPVISPDLSMDSHCLQPASSKQKERDHQMWCPAEAKKRIIVVGAGPAGLTAARHLQRQGFHVIVLEARGRTGGRVFTDCSSLSVPVDLGASIITGVEADVATERRPDPSSLVCAQLGLELTVLNSDCPLYDIVTGQKVPADLDETLEAEYNSLLDDMVLLVAQKGEHAMRMSLEDGLEYALKRRQRARSGRNCEESDLLKKEDFSMDSRNSIADLQVFTNNHSREDALTPIERRVMDWHFANLEYGCAALLKEVSLPYWNQDDVYGGFGGAHCMIKGGYSAVVESMGDGLCIHLNHVVTKISYRSKDIVTDEDPWNMVRVSTSNGQEFTGDAVLVTVPLGCLKAETIKFSPPLPEWKYSSIQRLGFGVLNKVVLEFPEAFWDESVDYFGATAEETNGRGRCFMFWNVKKTVGAPVLIALVVGKAAIDGQNISSSNHVNHALTVLRKLFGEASVPDPVASVVTDWGRDPYSYGAYSYVAVGASGEDYDILGKPIENSLFFAGEATCKEHPDTVGGAMMSGLREAVRMIDILNTGTDFMAEVETMETSHRHTESERGEVRDIIKRLDAVELSNILCKNSSSEDMVLIRKGLLQDMFSNANTTLGRLHLAKELLKLPVELLKSIAGTKEGLGVLNSWILDSMGKDGTQLLRHCVRLLVLVSTDLLAVRLSGVGKTVREKVCVHTSRDIRAIASQLVSVWIEVFRKEKASNGGLKLLRQSAAVDPSKTKSNIASGKPPNNFALDLKGSSKVSTSAGALPPNSNLNKVSVKSMKLETKTDTKLDAKQSKSQGSGGTPDDKGCGRQNVAISEEEQAASAAAEAARAAALAAAEAYASSGAQCDTSLQLPKIPSFHKFARREQYAQMEESDLRRRWSGGALGRQDCISEIDSRNCRVRDWSVDFSAAGIKLDSSKMSADNHSQRSHSNEVVCQFNFREHSGESAAVDSSIFTKAWVDSAGSVGIKDYDAIERWRTQAAAADSDNFHHPVHLMDEEDSNMSSKPPTQKHGANESAVSQVTVNRELLNNQPRGAEDVKQAVVDYVASLLMPLYKARKIDRESYKSIMKKTATKVMEQTTDSEKAMPVFKFLDFKRKNKIRAFVDLLIERHMAMNPGVKS